MADPAQGVTTGRVAGDVTIAELTRRIDRMDIDQRERFRAIDDRFTNAALATVPRDVYEERHLALRGRVQNLEEASKQALIYRRNMTIAVVASIIGSLVGAIAGLLAVTIH